MRPLVPERKNCNVQRNICVSVETIASLDLGIFSECNTQLGPKKQFDIIKRLCDNFVSCIIFCRARLYDALFQRKEVLEWHLHFTTFISAAKI